MIKSFIALIVSYWQYILPTLLDLSFLLTVVFSLIFILHIPFLIAYIPCYITDMIYPNCKRIANNVASTD